MNYWDILGIPLTSDAAVIKRAYAKKIKIFHPEDDPKGFQRLREAYENALQQAKFIESHNNAERELQPAQEEVYEEPLYIKPKEALAGKGEIICSDILVEQFMNKVEDIYYSMMWRSDAEYWKKLLADESYWNLELKQKLSYRILKFLSEQFELSGFGLTPAVWKLLNEHFFWEEQEKELYHFFSAEFIEHIMERVRYEKKVREQHDFNTGMKKYAYILFFVFLVLLAIGIIMYTAPMHSIRAKVFGAIIALRIFWYLPDFYKNIKIKFG
jgi:hypothetical protein